MHTLANIFLGLGAIIAGFFGGAGHLAGTTLTTLNGSDHQNTFPTTYNANNTAINNGKIEVGSTSIGSITTLANLATVGTIGAGIWQGTAIGAAFGGTGSTTLSANQVLVGNGTGNIKTVSGWGTSGQSLVSTGPATAPTWQSVGVDQSANYAWTGTHNFTGTTLLKTLTSSSTIAINNGGAGVSWSLPTSQGAANTFLKNDGAGNISWATSQTGVISTSTTFTSPTTQLSSATKTVYCVAPKLVAGGGYSGVPAPVDTSGNVGILTVNASYPDTSSSWTVTVYCGGHNISCSGSTVTVYALCVNP